MEVERIGIKAFATGPVDLRSLIAVFHGWIQKQSVPEHLLIDVHDYSHVHNGPGILLVAHEGNFSLDMADGRPGMLYYRKQPLKGAAEDRLAAIVKITLDACRLLEAENIRFSTDELLIVANDRLNAPNDESTFAVLQPAISAALKRVFEGRDFRLTPVAGNRKERFTVHARTDLIRGQ